LSKLDLKAVILAVAAIFGIDALVGSMLFHHWSGGTDIDSLTPEERKTLVEQVIALPGYLFAQLISGSLTTILGGYLAARLAHSFPYYNALAFGVVCVGLVVWFWTLPPLWYSLLGFVLSIPLALYGAYLCVLRMQQKAEAE
jgi:hypothetical protein